MLLYDEASGNYVNAKNGLTYPKAKIVKVLRNYRHIHFYDLSGLYVFSLNDGGSSLFKNGELIEEDDGRILTSIVGLLRSKIMIIEVWLALLFLGAEKYKGDTFAVTSSDVEILVKIITHDIEYQHKLLHKILHQLCVLGFDLCNEKFVSEIIGRYTIRLEMNCMFDWNLYKIVFWKMFELGLSIELRNHPNLRNLYVQYVSNLTLFDILKHAIKN